MNFRLPILAGVLFLVSSVAVATANPPAKTTEKVSTCEVANGCVKYSKKNLRRIDDAVSKIDRARSSNDPKVLRDALEVAYRSLSDVEVDEGKNARAMRVLHDHLNKVEERAQSLNNLLSGDGLDAQFIIQ